MVNTELPPPDSAKRSSEEDLRTHFLASLGSSNSSVLTGPTASWLQVALPLRVCCVAVMVVWTWSLPGDAPLSLTAWPRPIHTWSATTVTSCLAARGILVGSMKPSMRTEPEPLPVLTLARPALGSAGKSDTVRTTSWVAKPAMGVPSFSAL
ncbi:MAG: hypothetical protein IPJ34_31635 [Myxococcales bacterium]|nr:hypothetical protein [Myxococcales bacterium]